MEQECFHQLKRIKVSSSVFNPAPSWMARARFDLLQRIDEEASVEPPQSSVPWFGRLGTALMIFFPGRAFAMARHAFMFALVAGVAVGGWIVSASASEDSLPGDVWYGVKLAIEKTEVAVADVVGAREAAAAKELDFAARRAEEAKKSSSHEQKIVALESLKKTIESTSKRLEMIEKQSPEKAVAVAAVVSEKTELILATLETSGKGKEKAPAITQHVHETEKLIEDTGVKAVKVLIEKGDADTAKETVEKKLEKIATDLVDITHDAGSLATSTIAAPSSTASAVPAAGMQLPIATSSVSSTVSDSGAKAVPAAPEHLAASAPIAIEGVKKDVQEKIVAAEVRIDEVKHLIEGNNLRGAIEKVQEIYTLKNEAKIAVIKLDIVAAQPAADGTKKDAGSGSDLPILPAPSGTAMTTTITTTPSTSLQTAPLIAPANTGIKSLNSGGL